VGISASMVSEHLAVIKDKEAEGTNDVRKVMAVAEGKKEARNDETRVMGTGSSESDDEDEADT